MPRDMIRALWVCLLVFLPGRAAAQLPFDITREDVQGVDTSALRWTRLNTHVGGVDGAVRYSKSEATLGECKAVAVLAGVRMQRQYVQTRQEEPVSLRLDLRCEPGVLGVLSYDGLVLRLELRDASSGSLLYEGRSRGFP